MKSLNQARAELFFMLLSVTLLISPMLFAQTTDSAVAVDQAIETQTPAGDLPNDQETALTEVVSESENADLIAQKHPFALENQSKDPFKPLIEKPKPIVLPPDPKPNPMPDPRPQPQPIKPLSLLVQGICGNEGSRWALVTYENQVRVVTQDMNVDGIFKVVAIEPDRLVVYSNKHQTRQAFNLSK